MSQGLRRTHFDSPDCSLADKLRNYPGTKVHIRRGKCTDPGLCKCHSHNSPGIGDDINDQGLRFPVRIQNCRDRSGVLYTRHVGTRDHRRLHKRHSALSGCSPHRTHTSRGTGRSCAPHRLRCTLVRTSPPPIDSSLPCTGTLPV